MARPLRVLVGVSGSVAAVKLVPLLRALDAAAAAAGGGGGGGAHAAEAAVFAETRAYVESASAVRVKVLATQHARQFFAEADVAALDFVQLWTDDAEWSTWQRLGDPVLHIELRKWADVFVVAPLDANTLAKLAHGLCDNLLTCVARAWDFAAVAASKPMLVAPAMNTAMWQHPLTAPQLDVLRSFGVAVIAPVAKALACGDVGVGAMAAVDDIARAVVAAAAGAASASSAAAEP